MDVILLEKVHKLGELGDTVKVKSGYGRNFLIPSNMAVPATAKNIASFETRRAEWEQAQAAGLQQAEVRSKTLQDVAVTVRARAGAEGKLFGSVGTADITEALAAAGHEVARKEVRLPTGSLREVGEFPIDLRLHADLNVTITVIVTGDEQPVEDA